MQYTCMSHAHVTRFQAEYTFTIHTYIVQVFAVEFIAFANEFVPFAIKFIGFAIDFVGIAVEFVAFALQFIINKMVPRNQPLIKRS